MNNLFIESEALTSFKSWKNILKPSMGMSFFHKNKNLMNRDGELFTCK